MREGGGTEKRREGGREGEMEGVPTTPSLSLKVLIIIEELIGIFWPHTRAFDSTSHVRICLEYGFLYAFEGGGKPLSFVIDKLISQIPILTPLVPGRG